MKSVLIQILGLLLVALLPAHAQFTYTTNFDGVSVTITGYSYSGSVGTLTVPTNIDGFIVSAIGSNAFKDYWTLTGITIPETVTQIEDSAFCNCNAITNVTLGRGITNIGASAFYNCAYLTSISIPNGVASIKTNTFGECFNLTNISIPDSVQSIGSYAFSYSGLTSLTISDSVINMGEYAFEDCQYLASVTIPGSLRDIPPGAFTYSGLKSVVISDGVTNIEANAFASCASLKALTIPESVGGIGSWAFSGTALTNVVIPNATTYLGYGAYANTSPTNVLIPASVTNIEGLPFLGCLDMEAINVDSGNLNYSSVGGVLFDKSKATLVEYPLGRPGSYAIPAGVTSIRAMAMQSSSLTSVTIPASMTNTGATPFSGCQLLTSISVDPGNTNYSSMNGVLFDKSQTTLIEFPQGAVGGYSIPAGVANIGDYAFYSCHGITNVTFPESVTSVGNDAFLYAGLTSLAIGSGVTNIESYAFSNLGSLTNLIIGNSVTSIGAEAFYFCLNLSSVTIPNNVTTIGDLAFSSCGYLTNAVIGSGVTNIGSEVFAWTSLRTVYFQGNAPAGGWTAYYNNHAPVYYLPGTSGWAAFAAGTGSQTIPWDPLIQFGGPGFGVSDNRFGFNVAGTTNIPIVVQACTDLANPSWVTLQTLTLTNGLSYFTDPEWTNYPNRYYRISPP